MAQEFETVAELAAEIPIVVVSAAGKRNESDVKVTDLAIKYATSRDAEDREDILDRFEEQAEDAGATFNRREAEDELRISRSRDQIISLGERMSARFLAEVIDGEYVDASEVLSMKRDQTGAFSIDRARTKAVLDHYRRANPGRTLVLGGYQYEKDDSVVVFDRGGSDRTQAEISAALGWDAENWTDQDGVMNGPPGIVKNPKTIEQMFYEEMRPTSITGSPVIQPAAVTELGRARVSTKVKNTKNPEGQGTIIVPMPKDSQRIPGRVVAVTGAVDRSLITIKRMGLNEMPQIALRSIQELDYEGISIEHIITSHDEISFSVLDEVLVETSRRDRVEDARHSLRYNLESRMPTNVRVEARPVGVVATIGYGHNRISNGNKHIDQEIAGLHSADGILSLSFVPQELTEEIMADLHARHFKAA